MHDVAGFAFLVVGLLLGLYLLVGLVLPFVATWLFGLVSFFASAVLLLRNGRLHPAHLPHLLKPGVAPLLALLCLALPAAHGLVLALTARTDLWPWVLGGNALLPVAWTVRSLTGHARERRRFRREGHDLEEVLSSVRARFRALGVDADRLEMAVSRREPEPWEAVAGDAAGTTMFPPADVEALLARVATLRPAFREVDAVLSAAYEETCDGRAPALPHPALAKVQARLATLEADAADVSRRTAEILWDREAETQG